MTSTATHTFRIAGLQLRLILPADMSAERMLPSFTPFACDDYAADQSDTAFTFDACATPAPLPADARLIDDTTSDMGRVRLFGTPDAYHVVLNRSNDTHTHHMSCDMLFTDIKASIDRDDPAAGNAMCSLLRVAFSQSVIMHRGISIHAAAVVNDARGYLFLGKSGTGKSTHARMWMKAIADTHLLNDDNPILRIGNDGRTTVYGSPWSGKTVCYINSQAMVGAIIRLHQAPTNSIATLSDADAFIALLPSCSSIKTDDTLYNALCDTIADIADSTHMATMNCRPDTAAAEMAHEHVVQVRKTND